MISRRLQQFLDRRVGTTEALEVLLLVHHHADRSWSAEEVAAALRMTTRAAAQTLEALGGRDLLDVRVTADVRYRYNPSSSALGSAVRQLAACYREERQAIVAQLSGSRPFAHDVADAVTLRHKNGRS